MMQDEEDTIALKELLFENYDFIKRLHIDFLSTNQMPFVNVMDFLEFSKKCLFADENLL